jgi:hypothetical protein
MNVSSLLVVNDIPPTKVMLDHLNSMETMMIVQLSKKLFQIRV